MVHEKVLAALAVNEMFGPVPVQVLVVAALLTTGFGFTVTVIVKAGPEQPPEVEVGVTRYCTVPEAELLGFIKT